MSFLSSNLKAIDTWRIRRNPSEDPILQDLMIIGRGTKCAAVAGGFHFSIQKKLTDSKWWWWFPLLDFG